MVTRFEGSFPNHWLNNERRPFKGGVRALARYSSSNKSFAWLRLVNFQPVGRR
jgi:hypothetical protein